MSLGPVPLSSDITFIHWNAVAQATARLYAGATIRHTAFAVTRLPARSSRVLGTDPLQACRFG